MLAGSLLCLGHTPSLFLKDSDLVGLGLDLTGQHSAEVKLKYGSTLKGPAGLSTGEKRRGAGNQENGHVIFKGGARSTLEPRHRIHRGLYCAFLKTRYAVIGKFLMRFWGTYK